MALHGPPRAAFTAPFLGKRRSLALAYSPVEGGGEDRTQELPHGEHGEHPCGEASSLATYAFGASAAQHLSAYAGTGGEGVGPR